MPSSAVLRPPPTWQGSRLQIISISARFSPCRIAASRSISWTSGYFAEALNPVIEVVERELQLFALHQLHDAPTHQINRRNQQCPTSPKFHLREAEDLRLSASARQPHTHPARCSSAFSSRESVTPKWKMLAASAASALPRPKTSRSAPPARAPAGDDRNLHGLADRRGQLAVEAARMPSVSMLVSRISPAPRSSASRAHSTTRRPVGLASAADIDFGVFHAAAGRAVHRSPR